MAISFKGAHFPQDIILASWNPKLEEPAGRADHQAAPPLVASLRRSVG